MMQIADSSTEDDTHSPHHALKAARVYVVSGRPGYLTWSNDLNCWRIVRTSGVILRSEEKMETKSEDDQDGMGAYIRKRCCV